MSPTPIDLSDDLRRLRDEGYDIQLSPGHNHLAVHRVPYVDASCAVRTGILVCPLNLQADVAVTPTDHVMHFVGEYPCHEDGRPISEIQHGTGDFDLDGVRAQFSFSAKPPVPFPDYYEKVTSYVRILSAPAVAVDPTVRAQVFPAIPNTDESLPFRYADTATSRAGISEPTRKLMGERVAIVGCGGTGAYVLDLVAKTPVSEIHLWDPDVFSQHNAFRSPGAASIDVWADHSAQVYKVDYFAGVYSQLREGVIPHQCAIDEGTVAELQTMDFVFVCVDSGPAKRIVLDYLVSVGVPLVDVGMGLILESGKILGAARVTTVTPSFHDHISRRISTGDADLDDVYGQNIQVADMNALNAALAVIRWKKLRGFYDDVEGEHNSSYIVYSNRLSNDELA